MEKFYPKKLRWFDVVQIRKQQPSLCFSLIEKIMILDYRIDYFLKLLQTKATGDNAGSDSRGKPVDKLGSANLLDKSESPPSNPFDELESVITSLDDCQRLTASVPEIQIENSLHYMDVMNVIYNCCDNILLQTLMEKLYLCRLAIPLIFPSIYKDKLNFLLWSLRGIVPQYRNITSSELSLVDAPQKVFAFVRIGRLPVSKSRLLNEILSTNTCHNTFFHRDCENGMLPRFNSDGTVEASWYLPTASDGTKFEAMFTVLNLRGDFRDHPTQANWICRIGQPVFVLIDLNSLGSHCHDEFVSFFERNKTRIIVCIVTDTMESVRKCNESLKVLLSCLRSIKHQVCEILMNWSGEGRLLSLGEYKSNLQDVICAILKESNQQFTIAHIAEEFQEHNFDLDQNDPLCNASYLVAKHLTDPVGRLNPELRKVDVLRLQGEMWKNWTKLRKEQYRTQIPDELIGNFIAQKDSEQKECRNEQFKLIHVMPTFAIDICRYLETVIHSNESLYFINWMQLILNNWSRESMPPVLNNYCLKLEETRKKWNTSLEEKEKTFYKSELDKLKSTLDNTSFGIEHVFREFGQMYEATQSIYERTAHSCSRLPVVVAQLILQGIPFELMDGDTAFIPLTWVRAVFEEIKNIVGDKTLFVISVIGIQSSGKSTLLNALFGLKFAVSAGRCTKGLYCQLVPIDKENMNIDCDYLLIVDTEGLRAPELHGVSRIHDNELATFVIGLGDVTIVNIEGENNTEINDILQIVIHATIRIKLVKPTLLRPSCFFVHQNVSAVDAEYKLKIEKQTFLSKLDKITADAAREEMNSDIKHFQDIITYDEQKCAFYVPDSWQGQPPMSVVNPCYSEQIKDIKQTLTTIVSSCSTAVRITSFISKITDLWEAILCENFDFISFKNNEVVKVYSRLDETFTAICEDFKDFSLECQSYCQHVIQPIREIELLKREGGNLLNKIQTELPEKCQSLQIQLKNYFDNHVYEEILEHWQGRYRYSLENLCKDEQSKLVRILEENVALKSKHLDTTSEADLYGRERITEMAIKTAKKLRDSFEALNDDELGRYFSKEWPKWLQLFVHSSKETASTEIVLQSFLNELCECFRSHIPLLKTELSKNPLHDLQNHTFQYCELCVTEKDLYYRYFKRLPVFNAITQFRNKCFRQAIQECTIVFNNIEAYVKSCVGSDYLPGMASQVIKPLRSLFYPSDASGKQSEFQYKHEFMIRFTVEICKCAANQFIQYKINYLENYDPLADIRSKKSQFLELFISAYKNIVTEYTASD